MNEYDIGEAFSKIENELISSMIRNMDRHRAEETQYGYEWSMWQTEQLKALERYKQANLKKYPNQFKNINEQITALIQTAHDTGSMEQEEAILKAIKNGFKGFKKPGKGISGEFFRLNERKLEALIEATINDMERAETAILRMANDKYRSAIYDAQVFYNTGAGTYEKALDMATKAMLSAGLNCIEYKNGSRHRLKEYAGMALRTASTRAYLYGEGQMRQKWGVHTVIVAKRTNPCPKCLPFVGKVMIDDVWSGGSARDGPYPLISAAIAAGLYHPNCKDIHTTYFPGISEPPDDTWTEAELKDIEQFNKDEAEHQYVSRQVEKFGRLEKYSLDKENKKIYGVRKKEWEAKCMNEKSGLQKTRANKTTDTTIEGKSNSAALVDITQEWTKNNGIKGNITKMQQYTINGVTYNVDKKHVILSPTSQEKTIAAVLSEKYGKSVKFVPQVLYPQGIQTPDYLIDGERFDLKSPTGNGKELLYNMIAKKKKQSPNFIFDITNCPLSDEDIKMQIQSIYASQHTKFVKIIVIIKDKEILSVYNRV